MRIATWNVNSIRSRVERVAAWTARELPDVLCFQEIKTTDDLFPIGVFEELGYEVATYGQKTYNGVAILSRSPATEVQFGVPGLEDEQKRVIAATVDGVRIVDLYVVNGQSVGSDKYAYKLRWIQAVHDWLAAELQRHPKLVVLGDFNIAPEDRDTHDPMMWNELSIHSSTGERAALQAMLSLGLHDSFRLHNDDIEVRAHEVADINIFSGG